MNVCLGCFLFLKKEYSLMFLGAYSIFNLFTCIGGYLNHIFSPVGDYVFLLQKRRMDEGRCPCASLPQGGLVASQTPVVCPEASCLSVLFEKLQTKCSSISALRLP